MPRQFFAAFAVLCCSSAFGDDTVDSLFANWGKVSKDVKTLEIKFAREQKDLVLRREMYSSEGIIRLLRTPQGELFASYDQVQPDRGSAKNPIRYVLRENAIYQIMKSEKSVVVFHPHDDNLIRFLGDNFCSAIFMLDRKLAEKNYTLTIAKQDDHYTYLHMAAKGYQQKEQSEDGILAILKQSHSEWDKGMPRLFRYTTNQGKEEVTYHIKNWRLNTTEITRDEFQLPDRKDGWKYSTSFFSKKKDSP